MVMWLLVDDLELAYVYVMVAQCRVGWVVIVREVVGVVVYYFGCWLECLVELWVVCWMSGLLY